MYETLLRRAAAGDHDAFEQLVLAHQKAVYNLALRMTGSPDDALDLSQEAFLRAWRGLPDYRSDASFSTWLYRLTSNICIDFLRRRAREKIVPLCGFGEDEDELPLPDPGPDAETRALSRLERQEVAAAMLSLDLEYRQALTLRVIDGLSYAEIAETLNVPAGTVKSRIARAREKMRALLQKSGNKSGSPSSKGKKGG